MWTRAIRDVLVDLLDNGQTVGVNSSWCFDACNSMGNCADFGTVTGLHNGLERSKVAELDILTAETNSPSSSRVFVLRVEARAISIHVHTFNVGCVSGLPSRLAMVGVDNLKVSVRNKLVKVSGITFFLLVCGST